MVKLPQAIKLVFLLLVLACCGQKRKYWIYFEENIPVITHSEKVSSNCQSGLQECKKQTVYQNYLEGLDVSLKFYSHWLNAGTALIDQSQVKELSALSFVADIHPVQTLSFKPHGIFGQAEELSFALEQIEARHFFEKGLSGKNVKVGIIDGGFLEADVKSGLSHIFDSSRVHGYKDFLTPDLQRYGGSKAADDGHGTEVWEQISGMNTERNVRFGMATGSGFYLARTDDGRKEYRQEEEYLIGALEWMEKQGVKLVNISLGYSNGYDNPHENYLPEHIDGNFTAITRAAQIATEEKGMLLVVSAGNDGNTAFKVLSAPADAQGVIAVGATNFKVWDKASYSSIGPESLGFLKPNISCFSFNGTSFSAPVITGLAACIMQMDSTLSNLEIKSLIEQSGHLYPFGNNYIGYGVPSCRRILERLESEQPDILSVSVKENRIEVPKRKVVLKLPFESGTLVLFNKKDSINVLFQEKVVVEDYSVTLTRPKDARFTTVATKGFVQEVRWD